MDVSRSLAFLAEKVEGALMTILLDPRGVVLAHFPPSPPFDPERFAARCTLLFNELIATSTRVGPGKVQTILMDLEQASLVALSLKDGSILSLLLRPGGDIGRAVFEAKKTAFFLEGGLLSGL